MSLFTLVDAHAQLRAGVGAVEVDFDLSVLGQVALFLVLLVVLKPLLFDPMLRLFEERERRTDGAKREARKIDEASAGALTKYEQAMHRARLEAGVERDRLRAEGVKVENEILSAARLETARLLEEGKMKADAEMFKVRASLRSESPALAKLLAGRVLGREVQG